MLKNMYTVAGNGPCNEELALRIQAGDKNAAERLVSQNEGYLTELARAYTPWCEAEDLKQEAALALLDAARRFDPAHGTKLLTYATPAIEAALSDYASRYAFPLSVPTSRGSQLRTVAHLCAEAQDTSESELTKAVCEKLKVLSLFAHESVVGAYVIQQMADRLFSVGNRCSALLAFTQMLQVFLMGNSCVYAIDMVKLRCGWFNPSDIYKIGGSVMFRFMQKQSGLSHFGFWPSPHLWTGQLKIYHVGA